MLANLQNLEINILKFLINVSKHLEIWRINIYNTKDFSLEVSQYEFVP